jgi:hypothetical protein
MYVNSNPLSDYNEKKKKINPTPRRSVYLLFFFYVNFLIFVAVVLNEKTKI